MLGVDVLVYRFGHKFVFDSNLAKETVCFKIFKRDVDELLHEDEEERAYQREREQKKQQVHKEKNHRADKER